MPADGYQNPREAFEDPELFGTSAMIMCYDLLGDFLEWEPETIEADLRARGCAPSKGCMDRMLAAAAVRASNSFHTSLESFMDICHALNFKRVAAGRMSEVDLDDVCWGSLEARVIEGTDNFDEQGFADEIRLFAGFLLDKAGFDRKPAMLAYAELPEGRGGELAVDGTMLASYRSNVDEMISQLDAGSSERLRKLFGQIRRLPLRNGQAPA